MKLMHKKDYLVEYEEVCKILGIIRTNVKEIKSTLKLLESTFAVSIEEKKSNGRKTATLNKNTDFG